MAVFAATDFAITINSVNLSDHLTHAELLLDAIDLVSTTFGSTGWTSHVGGLKSGTLTLTFLNDFAASNVDATLWPLLGTVVTFTIKPTSGANSTTNPQYSGSVLIKEHRPFSSNVGDLAQMSVSYPTTGAVARATS